METRKLGRATFASACMVCTVAFAIPVGAVGLKATVVQASTTSKANAAKAVNKVEAPSTANATPYEMAKSTWGAPAQPNYYGLPTSDAQRKFK